MSLLLKTDWTTNGYYSQPKTIGQQISLAFNEFIGFNLYYMNKEVIRWLWGVKQGAPEVVFQSFLQMAQEELSTERMTNVQATLELV